MRKTLGVVVVSAALCVMAWAQAPGTAPPQGKYPRLELSGGYAYARTDLFNTGDRARLNGWDAEFGVNITRWMGFVFDGSGLYGTSKVPTAVPKPFPTCPPLCPTTSSFNVDTTLYNYLFGLRFPYRKSERWTPFGDAMFGHSGMRGEPQAPGGNQSVRVSGGLGLQFGGGVDYAINPRFAVRLQGDYLQTNGFKLTQDNFRVSVGIVIRSVKKKKRTLEETVEPQP